MKVSVLGNVDLTQFAGCPVLVRLNDRHQSRCAGALFAAGANEVLIQLDNQPWEPVDQTPARVSIQSAERLVQLTGICSQVPGRSDLIRCTLPPELEVLDRRKHPRVQVAAHVQYWTDAGAEPEPVPAETVDLCQGGLSFDTRQAPPVGAGVWVRFSTPPLAGLGQLSGRVLRVQRTGGGICKVAVGFRYLPEEAERQLAQVVEWQRWLADGHPV